MSRLTRDGTAEPVSRDQILRHARGQGNVHFPCSADHEQDWQPYPVDPYSAICDDHTILECIGYRLPIIGVDFSSNQGKVRISGPCGIVIFYFLANYIVKVIYKYYFYQI